MDSSYHKTTLNEKLRKRTLRSKITKVSYEHFFDKCPQQARKEAMIEHTREKIKQIKSKEYEQLIKQPNFSARGFNMTPYNQREFIPGNKQAIKIIDRPQHQVIDINQLDTVQAIMKSKLSQMDLLEIGEDPAYFIQNPKIKHAKHQNYLVSNLAQLNWVNDQWLDGSRSQSSNPRLRVKPISSDSNLLRPRQPPKVSLIDPLSLKDEMLTARQEHIRTANKHRFNNFLTNQARELERQELIDEKLRVRYRQKLEQTDKRLYALIDGAEKKREESTRAGMERLQQLASNMQQRRENDEIMALAAQLRRKCIEKQVNTNVRANIADKLDRLKAL